MVFGCLPKEMGGVFITLYQRTCVINATQTNIAIEYIILLLAIKSKLHGMK